MLVVEAVENTVQFKFCFYYEWPNFQRGGSS